MSSPQIPDAELIAGPAIVITQDARRSILRDAYVASTGGRITYIGDASGLPPLAPGGERLDASGQFVVPGFIDTHTHLYQTLMKGLGDDMGLMVWLDRLTLPTIPHLTGTDCYLGAVIGLTEALHSGTTSVLDFFVATEYHGLWDGIARGYRETGVRGFLGLGIADNLARRIRQPLEEQLADIYAFEKANVDPLLTVMLGPGSCWAMTREGFERLRAEADRTGIGMTLHLNEAVYDCEENVKRYGEHTVPMLERLGFLGPDVVLAHCCYLTDEDITILARTGAAVATNPISNMYLGNAFVRLNALLDAGVTVGIGPDGAASNNTQDMFEAIKLAALVQKGRWEDAAKVTAQQALDIATLGGARSLRMQDDLGSIEPGKLADFFLFDPRDVRSGPWHEPVSAIVYSGGERNVTTTVVDGRVVMRDRVPVGIDEAALVAEAQGAADALRERAGTGALIAARPYCCAQVTV
jgi:5-methylthioadenosine/S-adenosylhomocysteine deaminase